MANTAGDVRVIEEEIPADEVVIALVEKGRDDGVSPGEVLATLVADGYRRADSQRAMQRVLDRGKIRFNVELKLVALPELVDG